MAETDGITYYDHIAGTYDSLMDAESVNRIVRDHVKEYFLSRIPPGVMLDFGGGTGADHQWLINSGYDVYFHEPSEGMEMQARLKSERAGYPLRMISSNDLEFRHEDLKVNSVLANFAVLNCIQSLEPVFRSFANLLKPGDHVIANVLNSAFTILMKHHLRSYLMNRIAGRQIRLRPSVDSLHTQAYLYTLKEFEKASSIYFTMKRPVMLPGRKFMLLDFVRNTNSTSILNTTGK